MRKFDVNVQFTQNLFVKYINSMGIVWNIRHESNFYPFFPSLVYACVWFVFSILNVLHVNCILMLNKWAQPACFHTIALSLSLSRKWFDIQWASWHFSYPPDYVICVLLGTDNKSLFVVAFLFSSILLFDVVFAPLWIYSYSIHL